MRITLLFCLYAIAVSAQDGNITCSVPPTKLFQDAVLTCNYPEDLRVAKKDFSVNYNPYHPIPDPVIDCWWIRGNMSCSAKPGIMYQTHVNKTFTITFTNVTSDITGAYACQVANYDPNLFQTCHLEIKTGLEGQAKTPDQSSKTLAIALPLGLTLLAALVVSAIVFLLKDKGRLLLLLRGRKKPETSLDDGETQTMLKVQERQKEKIKKFQEYLESAAITTYPNMFETFYFVPPIYFTTCYKKHSLAREMVYVPDRCDPSALAHDLTIQDFLHRFRHLAENKQELMFVVTQFRYENYFNNVSQEYQQLLPIPGALIQEDNCTRCFDVLVIHREVGVLVGVVKAVSDRETHQMIAAQVNEAIQQLKRAKHIVKHLMSDQQQGLNIRQTLIVPNLSYSSLEGVLTSQDDSIQNHDDLLPAFAELNICANHLSDNSDPHARLETWWHTIKQSSTLDDRISEEQYLTLISRFCGPATQLNLQVQDELLILPKTLPEAVSITGDLFERPMLHPSMKDLLIEERLFLAGPPNTYKTRILTFVGRIWLMSGRDVTVLFDSATQVDSLTCKISDKLIPSPEGGGTDNVSQAVLSTLQCNFNSKDDLEEISNALMEKKRETSLCVLASDIDVTGKDMKVFKDFCESLKTRCPELRLWATCSASNDIPGGWRVETFTQPLDCPPEVIKELLPAAETKASLYLPPTEGPPVKYFHHKRGRKLYSHDCAECGKEVAGLLLKHFITRRNQEAPPADVTIATNTAVMTIKRPSELQVQDLLIVLECDMNQGERFLAGIRESGIAVRIEEGRDGAAQADSSASAVHVNDLNRYWPRKKIVVYVESKMEPEDLFARWRGITSCLSQLILVRRNL